MKITTQIDFDQLVDIYCALNSLQFAIERLEKLDEKNFGVILYQIDRNNLIKAKEAMKSLHENKIPSHEI